MEFKAYYRDGNEAERHAYSGRFVIEETSDGETWTTIYTSSTDEDTVTHYLYSILTNSSGQAVASSNGSTIGIPRDVTNVRCKLYASGGTTTLMDMQSVAVVIDVDNLTQSQIVEILSNDGAWKGLYYKNGQLYISFNAALGGELTLGGVNNGNGVQRIYDKNGKLASELSNSGQILYDTNELASGVLMNDKLFFFTTPVNITSSDTNVTGTAFYAGGISRFAGTIRKDDTEIVFDNEIIIFTNEEGEYSPPLWFSSVPDTDSLNGEFRDLDVKNLNIHESGWFNNPPTIIGWGFNSSAYHVGWDDNIKNLSLIPSSSKRYKDLGNNISSEELDNWYNIEPLWAKYKEGYLVEGDENEGRYIPMFIAEDVEEYFPEATRHANGQVEDWNERIMIPAMFAMIKSQKSEIDLLKQELNEIKQLLRKE